METLRQYNKILPTIKKNELESVPVRWMNLGPIQSKVSQKEKNKYRILMHIYGI